MSCYLTLFVLSIWFVARKCEWRQLINQRDTINLGLVWWPHCITCCLLYRVSGTANRSLVLLPLFFSNYFFIFLLAVAHFPPFRQCAPTLLTWALSLSSLEKVQSHYSLGIACRLDIRRPTTTLYPIRYHFSQDIWGEESEPFSEEAQTLKNLYKSLKII